MILSKTGQFVSSKIPSAMKELIVKSVDAGQYISVSEFVRTAVKEKLQREGYVVKGARWGSS